MQTSDEHKTSEKIVSGKISQGPGLNLNPN